MLRTIALLLSLAMASLVHAGAPSAASANGGAACPPEPAEANGEVAQPPTGMTTAAGATGAAGAEPAPRPSSASGGTRTRTKLRWHAFVPGMFK